MWDFTCDYALQNLYEGMSKIHLPFPLKATGSNSHRFSPHPQPQPRRIVHYLFGWNSTACVMQEARTDDLMVPPGPKEYLQIIILDEIYMPCTKSKPAGFGWEQEFKERNFALALSQKLDKQLRALAWWQQRLLIHCLSIFFVILTVWVWVFLKAICKSLHFLWIPSWCISRNVGSERDGRPVPPAGGWAGSVSSRAPDACKHMLFTASPSFGSGKLVSGLIILGRALV